MAGVSLAGFAARAGSTDSTDRKFPPSAERLLHPFRAEGALPSAADYEKLFRYFLTGFVTYSEPHGSLAYYPGLRSRHGTRIDAMEGFSRFGPLAAAWIHSGRPARIRLEGEQEMDLVEMIERGLLNGTDVKSPGYWGAISDRDQRMVEAADIALVLWLTRDSIWSRWDKPRKDRVHRWLADAPSRAVPDNNWHLFPTFISLVLEQLGRPADRAAAQEHYRRFKTFYRGEGWFSDGPGRVYDYYNAWGIHYLLYWINQVDPAWDAGFIAASRGEFLRSYKYLVGRRGVPIMGRSICYRLAAPAPLVFDHASSNSTTAGQARRALDLTWTYFIRHGAVAAGSVTQGYCGADERILDNYSGPASCLWSLRSLIPAFALPPDSPFWTSRGDSLPIDGASYRVRLASLGWTLTGDPKTGVTTIIADDSLPDSLTNFASARRAARLRALVSRHPGRPVNRAAKYYRGTYHSEPAFCGCPVGVSHAERPGAPGPQSSPSNPSWGR